MADFLDEFIKELLHTDDVRANRLLHSGLEGESIKSYRLFAESGETCEKMLSEIKLYDSFYIVVVFHKIPCFIMESAYYGNTHNLICTFFQYFVESSAYT